MAIHQETWAFIFGLLGNVISLVVFLAPIPTFHEIYIKKTSEGFHPVPYVVALFSCSLWIYYAAVSEFASNLLITINLFGCLVEPIYLAIFLKYASKETRLSTIKLLVMVNVFGYGAVIFPTLYLTTGTKRASIVGWICLVFSIGVFAAPCLILKKVIQTKSVEYMPITLSICLTMNSVVWLLYGLLLKNPNIAIPNVLGLLFGVVQIAVYLVYRKKKETESGKV